MAESARSTPAALYDQDFFAWSGEQALALKKRNVRRLDWDNLAEEIGTLGRSERSEIRSRLVILLTHLLKWQYQPERRKAGWAATILEARDQLNERLRESPSLRAYPVEVLAKQYKIARLHAADETGLGPENFPERCPYEVAEVLDETFMPGADT